MIKHWNCAIAAFLLICSASSCLTQNFEEADALLKTDVELVHAPCDLITNEVVTSDFTIISNRAWSASIPDDCDWLELSSLQESNLANVSRDYKIKLEFENNEGEERETEISVKTNYEERKVKIRQDAITPRLVVTSSKYNDYISSEGESFKIDLLSNVRWSCSVDEGSTASISIDRNSGKYNASVYVSVAESMDKNNMSKARVRFKAYRCEDQVVEFIQRSAYPYFDVTDIPDREIYSIGEIFSIGFKSNSSWTAQILDGIDKISSLKVGSSTKNISSGSFSGTKNDNTITITCIGNSDPDNYDPIKFSFTPEGGNPVELQLDIDKSSHMDIVFVPVGGSFDSPFKTPTKSNFSTSGNSRKWGGEYYPLNCYNPDIVLYIKTPPTEDGGGVWRNSNQGFRAGPSTGTDIRENNMTFLVLPAIQGKALSKIKIVTGYSCRYDVRSADNTIVEGGDLQEANEANEILEYSLKGTQANTNYYLTGSFAVRELELWYE